MKQKASYFGKVEDGKMAFMRHAMPFIRALEGKQVRVTIEEYKPTRSTRQNAYYWAVVVPVVQEIMQSIGSPLDSETTHELILRHILGKTEMREVEGRFYQVRLSSKDLETLDWELCMEQIRAWCAERGKIVPLPNEYDV